jgi:hypothetical protein
MSTAKIAASRAHSRNEKVCRRAAAAGRNEFAVRREKVRREEDGREEVRREKVCHEESELSTVQISFTGLCSNLLDVRTRWSQ